MACVIKILGVIGQKKAGKLIAIKVVGSGSNCDLVNVIITCDGVSRSTTSKVTDGAWSVVAPPGAPDAHPCQCDAQIEVTAECISGQCYDKFSGMLICQDITSCPDVFVDVPPLDPNSRCDGAGKRSVSGSVTVSPDPSTPVGVTVSIDGTTVATHAATATPYTVTFTVALYPGTHKLKVVPDDPQCGAVTVSIAVPACPGTESCPKVELQQVAEGDCRAGKRVATVTVLVTPQGGPTDAELTHGSTTLDKKVAQVAPFVLSGSDSFTPGGDAVLVNVAQPPGCPPTSLAIDVAPCPTDGQQPPPPPQDGGSDDGDGSGGCLIGRIVVELLLGTALFLFLVAFCVPGAAPGVLIAAGIAAAAGAVAFALWWLLCGSKCGALLMLWQIAIIGAWVSLFLASCCPAALILAIGLGLAGIGLFFGWLSACKPSSCKILSELLWVFAVAIGPIFAYLVKLVPCGLPLVPGIAATIAAGLVVAVKKACKM